VKTGIQVRYATTVLNPDARLGGHNVFRASTTYAGASTLIGRSFGITFSAKSRMLLSVYSRGALPTEKFAINSPKLTFFA
jgi:hypothetical protein